ncbi:MAG: hypothetical protein KF833_04325 [Verrucomicrobiae bacterium]|nr:hypothetical protein [Verrucomicrobiae bacterium]
MNTPRHPWVLTGPWYRWADPYDANAGRRERPVFQKYDNSDLVNAFLKDPQRSLKFVVPDDVVPEVSAGPGNGAGESAGLRKLFLDTHKRFYLVVCELHCDFAGFPNASRDDVCEAGFVVRRLVARGPAGAAPAIRKGWKALSLTRAQWSQFQELPPAMKRGTTLGLRATLESRYRAAQAQWAALTGELGIVIARQGWRPGEFQGVGAWQDVEATPAQTGEHLFPLHPLIPDPTVAGHSSGGRTLYFGLVPTGSSDVDATGAARFDDRSVYEVRCFVRRHNPKCPKRRERNDCKGELVWSLPTEPYRLAAPFDLVGTSHRPINIVLPDLPALEAQAAALAPGQGAPVRMISPPDSALEMEVDPEDLSNVSPKGKGGAICSFSIPLITIVASFVFRLFLPVVVFLFGLWFLLKIKFCIPPMVSLDAGVSADLDIALPKIEAGIDIDIAVNASLLADLKAVIDPMTGRKYSDNIDTTTKAGREELVKIVATQSIDFSASLPENVEVDPSPAGAVQRELPGVTANLEYEARVETHPA